MRAARPSAPFHAVFSHAYPVDKPSSTAHPKQEGPDPAKDRGPGAKRTNRRRYGSPRAVPLMVTRPGPGRPATLFTEVEPVGPTQNTAPSVGWDTSLKGGSSMPMANSVMEPYFPQKPTDRKHARL